MTPAKVLVSACLLGRPVRYNGSAKTLEDALLDRWISEGRVVSVCPEVMAGLPTPRPPAEIAHRASGAAVIERDGSIVEADGTDVTEAYLAGARIALEHATRHDCRYALLTDGSPSCGGSFIYDGSFQGRRIDGEGVTAALLRQHGIAVFSQAEISSLAAALDG
ncbi:purine nucleoside phosphorylase [Novosphingobium sp. AAP1]|uniref:DUF523 domain-containing protein n=1 Tax=Novosphingobium sp. AAP1 TaxID=1523413 RepID=UPI0006B9991C|nr:DUF523 domain-containing protein [Novosphingobium sp. AAP1]KPF49273.1 purine nucleoside phosphorylase [Novosphingobium sp. AAP1]